MVMQPGKHVGGGWCACLGNEDVTSVGASVAEGVGSPVDRVDCGWIQGWARVLMSRASPKREEWEEIGLVVGTEEIDLFLRRGNGVAVEVVMGAPLRQRCHWRDGVAGG